MNLKIYTDGAARGNPGPAGIGVVIFNENGEVIEEHYRYLGVATNNSAEYQALVEGLKIAKKYLPCSINVHVDSELVFHQMRGNYRVKDINLSRYFQAAQQLLPLFDRVEFVHVPRENNKLADKLANRAINLGNREG